MIELLFPSETQLEIDDVQVHPTKTNVYGRRCNISAPCPNCQQLSEKIHSQ